MKILYLTNDLSGTSGWSRYSLDLARELKKRGHEALWLVNNESSSTDFREKSILGDPHGYSVNLLAVVGLAFKVNKIVREFQPDIIHFIAETYAPILPFLNIKNIKSYVTIHGSYSVAPLFYQGIKKRIAFWLARRFYNHLDGVIAVSNFTKRHVLTYFPDLISKITVITNGVHITDPAEVSVKTETNHIKLILFVGAVKPRKGLIEAIDALKQYGQKYNNDFVYHIVGDHSDKDYYSQLVKKIAVAGLEKNVIFYGRVSEKKLSELYSQADLFFMIPINDGIAFEGFGLVYLEASAYGVPCIGAKRSGSEEAVFAGKTGFLVDPRDPAGIAAKIDLVLNHQAIITEDCRRWARENNISAKVSSLIDLYENKKIN